MTFPRSTSTRSCLASSTGKIETQAQFLAKRPEGASGVQVLPQKSHFLRSSFSSINSAICTALLAAPLRILSPTHQIWKLFG